MESFKANLIVFLFIAVVAGAAYWAAGSLKAKSKDMVASSVLEDVGPIVSTGPTDPGPVAPAPSSNEGSESPSAPATETEKPTEVSGTHASLVSEIQKLIDDNILMKKGSRGTRVGTVQNFLIEYGIDMKADNDYGDTTVNAVKKFQSEQGLSADGQTGAGTYKKMIEWLKAN